MVPNCRLYKNNIPRNVIYIYTWILLYLNIGDKFPLVRILELTGGKQHAKGWDVNCFFFFSIYPFIISLRSPSKRYPIWNFWNSCIVLWHEALFCDDLDWWKQQNYYKDGSGWKGCSASSFFKSPCSHLVFGILPFHFFIWLHIFPTSWSSCFSSVFSWCSANFFSQNSDYWSWDSHESHTQWQLVYILEWFKGEQ